MDDLIAVLVTCGSGEEARRISELVVHEHVAACVSMADVRSFFGWKGKSESQDEKLLIIKSVKSRFGDLEKLIKAHHSYECPEIIAVDVATSSKEYSRWVRKACRKNKS